MRALADRSKQASCLDSARARTVAAGRSDSKPFSLAIARLQTGVGSLPKPSPETFRASPLCPYRREIAQDGPRRSEAPRGVLAFGLYRAPFGEGNIAFVLDRMPFGEGKIPFGLDRKPFGEGNIAFGLDRKPFGEGNIAFGEGNTAFGLDRMPFGQGNIAFGLDRMPFGEGNIAFGEGNTVLGLDRMPFGQGNIAFGVGRIEGLTSFAVEKRFEAGWPAVAVCCDPCLGNFQIPRVTRNDKRGRTERAMA